MQVWFRLFRVGARALLRRADTTAATVSSLVFRVSPGDLDVNLHMNNGRYLTIMDLGRIDILIRTGLWGQMRKRGLTAVVGSQRIRYRIALSPWQRFRLESRMLAWDDDSIVFEHLMLTGRPGEERQAATATVRMALIPRARGTRRLKIGEVMQLVGFDRIGPPIPDDIKAWIQQDRRASPRT